MLYLCFVAVYFGKLCDKDAPRDVDIDADTDRVISCNFNRGQLLSR